MSASSESERMPQRQLGELMTELGLISQEQLATVLEVQQQSQRPLGQIIVELGFASGAAVAHALAMQSGGALRTEYGFALGVQPGDADGDAEDEGATLPKLRLAPTAAAPEARSSLESVEERELDDPTDPEPVDDAEPVVEAALLVGAAPVEEAEESARTEPEDVLGEAEASAEAPLADDADPIELERLRAEIERLENALAETQAEHEQDLTRLRDEHEQDLTRLRDEHEQDLARLRDEHEHTAEELGRLQAAAAEQERLLADIERLEAALAETQTTHQENLSRLQQEHERATTEIERLQTVLAEAGSEREQELARLQEERDEIARELEQLRAALAEAQLFAAEHERRLAEEQERNGRERDELAAQRDRIQNELGDALERLADAGPIAEERDRLRTEVEQLESTLAEQQERHAGERDELTAQHDRIQQELGDALERLAVVGPAAEQRDELHVEVERLQHVLAEVRESSAAELRGLVEERDSLAAELEEARELLRQAERVRESQIALEAERDRVVAELDGLRVAAAEAQAEAEERTRLLAEEQDLHRAERETLLGQRTMLEQELGSAIEQLAAAASANDEREEQLRLGSQRLLEALAAVRRLATELVPGSEELPDEPAADLTEPEAESDEPPTEAGADEPGTETEAIDYSLFVPGPNGYELVPQTGVPPQAGQIVELVLPDRDEPAVYEVVRSGRTLPGGDICVYLAQV